MKIKEKYAELHVHMLDRYDAQNDPDTFCKRLKELGAEGFALTQHGVQSAVHPARHAADKYGLKFVPGIEGYYKREGFDVRHHIILLPKNNVGYKTLGMAITDANGKDTDGMAVFTDEILDRYFAPGKRGHGNVILMTACIQGPLAGILRQNETVDREIAKLERARERYSDFSEERFHALSNEVAAAERRRADLIEFRDTTKRTADMKFTKREKALEKLKDKNPEGYAAELETLLADKQLAAKAAADLDGIKKSVTAASKKVSMLTKEQKILAETKAKIDSINEKIDAWNAKKADDDVLKSGAEREALRLSRLFGRGCFYMEMQYHGIPEEAKVYPILAEIARKNGLPLVATNDVHMTYGTDDERLQRQILRSMRFGTAFEDEHVGDAELYVKTDAEMAAMLSMILPKSCVAEAMRNVRNVLDSCNVTFVKEEHYPKFPSKNGMTANEMLDEEIEKGIKWRFPDGMDEAHRERLAHELPIIKNMGYADYHLVVKDFLEYARVLGPVPANRVAEAPFDIEEAKRWVADNGWTVGISVGPGRGSAVGSLVCYLLGITDMDPLPYGLLFERFLNPERISMPDIDSDISNAVRAKIIEYLGYKYGESSVCMIMTMDKVAPKGAIRHAAKYYGLKALGDGTAFLSAADNIAKKVPKDVGTWFRTPVDAYLEKHIDLEEAIRNEDIALDGLWKAKLAEEDDADEWVQLSLYDALRLEYRENHDIQEILRWAKIIEGCFTTYGAHAAGMVIADNHDVKEYMPLRWNTKLGSWSTQCDMVETEEAGLLKMDLLGLRTLDIIRDTIVSIERNHGISIDLNKDIPMDDVDVYREIFQKGKTNSVFQFESSGMKKMLKQFGPTTFEDLIILVSMFRPGPMQYLDGVIKVKKGAEPTYLVDELIPILGNTYSAIVYQEQVMAIFQQLAGYTLGGADQVRRYMSKKKADKLAHEREAFVYGDASRGIAGCKARGIDPEKADELFSQMEDFARYAFNKSHAAAYALNSYRTAYLKYHYPAEFLSAAMNHVTAPDKIPGLMQEAKDFGVEVFAPDINRSDASFTATDGKILFGLSSVKSVGASGDQAIAERKAHGEFRSYRDFFRRCRIKKDALQNLIKAGAFDSFCPNRKAMLLVAEDYQDAAKKMMEKQAFIADAKKLLPYLDGVKTEADLQAVQDNIGVHLLDKVTPVSRFQKRIDTAEEAYAALSRRFEEIVLPTDIKEDKRARMDAERSLLGAYVTAHPLDEYPSVEEIGLAPISEAGTDTKEVFGMLADVRIVNRRRDGRPMAFGKLEDRSGSIEVCVYTKKYDRLAKYMKDGNVLRIAGRIVEEETSVLDENGNPVTELKLIADTAGTVNKKKAPFVMNLTSYPVFHVDREAAFRKKYEDANGHPVTVLDASSGRARYLSYRISDAALQEPFVSELG